MEQTIQRRCVGLHTERITRREKFFLPVYSLGEEIFSAVSHGVAALMAIGMYAVLLFFCRREPQTLLAVHAFGISMILLYTVSTIYHALAVNRGKAVFRVLDHCTIFLLIAGTYTPICLLGIGGTAGIGLLAAVWAAAVVGITLNAVNLRKFAKASVLCYIVMGWAILFTMDRFYANAGFQPFLFLLFGGLFYTVGAGLYVLGKRIPYMHSVWHIFVLAGSVFHAITVFLLTT